MDINDLKTDEALRIVDELNGLIGKLRDENLRISSWWGKFDLTEDRNSSEWIIRGYNYQCLPGAVDDKNFPWFLYWEIVWVILNNKLRSQQRILDLGGSSSLFSFYLASKGFDVTTIDTQRKLVDNANLVAQRTGWNLKNYDMDIRKLNLDSKFDHITSICVFEHVPIYDRIVVNSKIKDQLAENGKFSITFDYRNPNRHARISSPKDIYEQFVRPSGLKIRGNETFFDNGENYLLSPFFYNKPSLKSLLRIKIPSILEGRFKPWEIFKVRDANNYTFGALFLEKA